MTEAEIRKLHRTNGEGRLHELNVPAFIAKRAVK